jgi:hypothetical protein
MATRLEDWHAVKARSQRPVIRPEAIALPPDPVVPVQEIWPTIRAATGDVFGPDAVPNSDAHQPHVSLAYVSTPQPASTTRDAINLVTTDPAASQSTPCHSSDAPRQPHVGVAHDRGCPARSVRLSSSVISQLIRDSCPRLMCDRLEVSRHEPSVPMSA